VGAGCWIFAFVGTGQAVEVNLVVWLVAGVLTHVLERTGAKVQLLRFIRMPCFSVLFYCEHRINHCVCMI
jgi:hypothetical protein